MTTRYETLADEARATYASSEPYSTPDDPHDVPIGRWRSPELRGWATLYRTPIPRSYGSVLFEPGCFTDHLRSGARVAACLDHNLQLEIASTDDGTLRFVDDHTVGLAAIIRPRDSRLARDLILALRSGMSNWMSLHWDRVETEDRICQGQYCKRVLSCDLVECSLVFAPGCSRATTVLLHEDTPAFHHQRGRLDVWQEGHVRRFQAFINKQPR